MSIVLLDKTRMLNKLLQNNHATRVDFNEICKVLSNALESNILVISGKGKLLGAGYYRDIQVIEEIEPIGIGDFFDKKLNERLLSILSTKENVNLRTLGFNIRSNGGVQALVAPIDISGERLGTLFMYKRDVCYEIEDIILGEYGATVVGLEMKNAVKREAEEKERKIEMIEMVMNTLSNSEVLAIKSVFSMLDKTDGIIVASKIAESTGITRSVIVNALKKFESAGVIATRSMGMKGTSIEVINDLAFSEIKKLEK